MTASLRNLALLCALLTHCLLAVAAPVMVLCEEADGARALELALTGCCEASVVAANAGEPGVRDQGTDCRDCADSALSLSLKRDDTQTLCFATAVIPAQRAAARARITGHHTRRPLPSNPVPNASLEALGTVELRC